jgi:Tfp pilus assembly protein PilV
MRVRAIAAAVLCVGVLGVSSCTGQSCGMGDYAVEGQHGLATPREVLRSVLAVNPSLSRGGWLVEGPSARSVVFRSGDDRVDVVKKSDETWAVAATQACQ